MKHSFKRVISLLLSVMMIISMLPTAALADEVSIDNVNVIEDVADDGLETASEDSSITYAVVDGTTNAQITDGKSASGDVVIPETVIIDGVEYTVTTIAANAFNDANEVTSIVVPNSVTALGGAAFANMDKLKSLTIGNGVTSWGSKLAVNNYELETVVIAEGATLIGDLAFRTCPKLSNVTLPSTLKSIGATAFAYSAITELNIPASVEIIGADAFKDIDTLKKVTFLGENTQLGSTSFQMCDGLEEVVLPANLTVIPQGAFRYCTSLKTINFPETLTEIGNYSFQGCTSLESVTISKNITNLVTNAFSGCTSLKDLTIEEGFAGTIGGYAFQGCTALESVVIPSSMETVGESMFNMCYNLKYVTLSEGVKTLNISAFANCTSLETLTLPDSLERMRHGSIANCTALKSLIITGENLPVIEHSNALEGLSEDLVVYYSGDDEFTGNWAALADNVAAPTEWDDESATEYVIMSVADLEAFAAAVNAGNTFTGKTVTLGADLDLAGVAWAPIGGWDGAVQFLGEFDGNEKTIFNLTLDDTNVTAAKYRAGLFADLGQGSSVHDLTFKNVTVTNTKGGQVGALSGRSGASLENIKVEGFTANAASGAYVGGVIGITNSYSSGDYGFSWNDVDAKDVTIEFTGTKTSYGGGLLGGMNPNGARLNTYDGCDVTNVTITDENIGWHGGMWGWHGRSGAFNYVKNATIANVNITTSGTGDSRVGGLCGFVGVSGGLMENITIDGGKLTAGGGFAGGFTPWSYAWGQDTYKNCTVNNVEVTCTTGVAGGFIAAAGAGNQTSKCVDCAVVGGTVSGRIASGFAGIDRHGNAGGAYVLEGCTSSAAVTGTEYAAGLIARASSSYQTSVAGSAFTGTVSGNGYVCEGVITTHTDKSLLAVDTVPVMYTNIKDENGNPTVETSSYVASVNGKMYGTLAEAVAAANAVAEGATVTLLQDVTLGEKLTVTGNVTISGAYTITRAAAYTGTLFEVSAGATLTLDGGLTIDGGNAWVYTKTPLEMDMANGAGTKVADHITPAEGGVNATAGLIVNNGTLNANKVTIENSYSTNGVSAINCGVSSVTTLNGATMQNIAANRSGAVLYVGGNDAVLTIKGDTKITGNFGTGNGGIIQNYGQGTTVNLEGGRIDNNHVGVSGTLYASYSGNANKINTFNMSGGTITENIMEGYGPVYIHTNTVWNMTGGEISNNTSFLPSYVRGNNNAATISGGKIVNNEIAGLGYNNGYYVTRQDIYLGKNSQISGGTFTQNVSEYLAPDTGLVYDEATGTYGTSDHVYNLYFRDPTTGEQVQGVGPLQGKDPADLVATGKAFYADYYEMELEVLSNAKIDDPIVVDYPMTINLNGHTITTVANADETVNMNPAIRVLADVTVTGEGKLDARATGYAFIVGNAQTAGKLTIKNGTYYGSTTVASVTKGELIINGGNYAVNPYQVENQEDNYNFLLNCIDANYKAGTAKITVNGGTFYKFNPASNAAEGAGTSFVAEGYKAVANGDYYGVEVDKDSLNPVVTITFTDSNGGNAVTLKYPSERYDSIQKLIGTNDYADFVLGAEQSELLAYIADGRASNIVMTLHDDIELDAPINFYNKYFQVAVEYGITIDGNDHTITWADGYTGTLLNVESGVSVTTKNLTIDGENAFTFYEDTTTVEDGQNWYTRFVNVGEEDKAVNADVIVNAGSLTLGEGTKIQNITIASDGANGKTSNTETGYVLMYNDDLAVIKSNGGTVTIDGAKIGKNAGLILNAINAETAITGSAIDFNMGCGNKGGIIIANGGTMAIAETTINNTQAMARSATVLGVINGAEVTFNANMNNNKHIGVGGNTAGAIVVLEGASQFVMNGGSISNNVGGRAGAIASRWVGGNYGQHEETSIVLNAGTITGNTAADDSWNSASIFLRSPATIGEGMTVEGTIAVNASPAKLAITGGTFNGSLIVTDGLTAKITGGTFNYDPAEWCAEGYASKKNADGTWTVDVATYIAQVGETKYTDLKKALEACTNGETVKLLADITYGANDVVYAHGGATGFGNYDQYNPSIIYIGGTKGATPAENQPSSVNAVLDLNGYTITNDADAHLFLIMDNAVVKFVDSSEAQTGAVISNCASYPAIWACGTDTLVTIEGGKYVTASATGLLHCTHSGDLVITGGDFSTTAADASLLIMLNSQPYNNPNYFLKGVATVTIKGGTFHGFNPEKVGDDYGASSIEEIKFVDAVPLGFEPKVDETGSYGVAATAVYEIHDVNDLYQFATMANAGNKFSGKTVKLMANIDLGGAAWTPIKSFAGTFDGGSYTISNFTLDSTSVDAGFFAYVGPYPAKVANLTLSDVTATAGANELGILAATANTTTVSNVVIQNVKVTTTHTNARVGGFFGYFNWTSATNSKLVNFEVDATKGAEFIGGYASFMDQNDDVGIYNVDIDGFKITATDTDGQCEIGGFTAQTQTGWRDPLFQNCDVTNIDIVATGTVTVGGFIADPGAHTRATNCTTEGKIDATGITTASCEIGGFFGDAGWNDNLGNQGGHKLTNCIADVDIITGGADAGGFIGSATNDNNAGMPITFTNCEAKGTVTVAEGGTAYIGGFAGTADRGTYNNCTAAQEPFIGYVAEGKTLTQTNSYVAKVGTVYYANFDNALAAAKEGDTVTILATVTVTEGKTYDFTGLTITAGVNPAIRITNGANVTVKGGEIKVTDGYCFILGASDGTTAGNLTIESGKFHGATSVASVTKGTLTITGGEFSVEPYEGSYAYLLNCIDANYKDGSAKIVVKGGTFTNFNPQNNAAEGANTSFVATGYAATETAEGSGIYTVNIATEFEIWTKADLYAFAAMTNAGETFSGKTVNLMADIDLGGAAWTPIAKFSGEFDGNSHIISNFTIDATASHGGFFNVLEWANVHDLTLSNVEATVGAYRYGTLARSINQTKVDNITVKNVVVTTTASTAFVAGLVCHGTVNSNMALNNCTVENLTVNAEKGAYLIAGIVTFVQKNGTEAEGTNILKNLNVNNFKVTVNDTDGVCAVGGLVGQTQSVWQNPRFNNCSVSGLDVTATGSVDVGGFMCYPGSWTYAENCTTEGKIDVTGVTSASNFAGGFFGNYGWGDNVGKGDHKVTNCSANVNIITKIASAGGFVGSGTNSEGKNKNITLTACEAKGTVTVAEGGTAYIGGFAGTVDRGIYNSCTAAHEPFIGYVAEGKTLTQENSYVAKVGTVYYANFDNALAAAKNVEDKTVTILATVVVTENTDYDFTGLTITAGVNPAIRITNDANVAVKGGEMKVTDGYCFILGASDGTSEGNLTIESGKFHGGTSVASVTKGTLTIKSGEFSVEPYQGSYDFLLNCIDANYKTGDAKIEVIGGTFANFNPANNAAEGANTSFVPTGYEAVANGDNTWTVVEVKNYVAQIGDKKYTTLQAAIEAAKTDETVTLLADITLTEADCVAGADRKVLVDVVGKDITLDMAGKTISVVHEDAFTDDYLVAVIRVADGAGLTVTGNGKIDVKVLKDNADVAYMFWKRGTTGHLTVENGTFHMNDSADSMVYTNGSEIVNIKGGTWTLDAVGTRENGQPWIFNAQGTGGKHIIITGGTFNADINRQHWSDEAVVAETCYVTEDNGTWTVNDGAVAHVAEGMLTGPYFYRKNVGYATFEEAMAAAVARKDSPVTLLENITLTDAVEINGSVNLDLNNKTLTGELTLTDTAATLTAYDGQVAVKNLTVTTNVNGYEVATEDVQVSDEIAGCKYKLVEAANKFDISFARMTLANALDMSFAFEAGHVADWTGAYVEIEKSYADGTTQTQTILYADWSKTTISGVRHYYVTFTGIAAKEMADEVRVTVYNAAGDALSNVWKDSVRDYAMRTLANPNSTSEEMTMIVDMLNYGAAAQTFFEYNEGDLANNELTDAQKAMATATTSYTDNRVKGTNFLGSNLELVNNIELMMAFNNVTTDMYAMITYTDHYGVDQEIKVDGSEFVANNGAYVVYINEAAIADARQLITCTIYDGETVVASASDNVESYVARAMSGSRNDPLFEMIMKFADSAYAYLH